MKLFFAEKDVMNKQPSDYIEYLKNNKMKFFDSMKYLLTNYNAASVYVAIKLITIQPKETINNIQVNQNMKQMVHYAFLHKPSSKMNQIIKSWLLQAIKKRRYFHTEKQNEKCPLPIKLILQDDFENFRSLYLKRLQASHKCTLKEKRKKRLKRKSTKTVMLNSNSSIPEYGLLDD